MGKVKMEEKFDLDLTEEPVQKIVIKESPAKKVNTETVITNTTKSLVNCLRNTRVIVRKLDSAISRNLPANHICSKGMIDGARHIYSVPRLQSGVFVNVLTNDEKDFLEHVLNLEPNALSIHKKENNFWDDSNTAGINKVILFKEDNILDLSNPEDYIRYKILLANKRFICPSMEEYERTHLRSYQFVIIEEGAESKSAEAHIAYKQQCYMEFGKIDNDRYKMAMILQLFEGKNVNPQSELNWLKTRIDAAINKDAKRFLALIKDSLLDTKILINKGVEAGIIAQKGDYYYYINESKQLEPLCNDREEPTFETAAIYLNLPKLQTLKFALEAALNNIN